MPSTPIGWRELASEPEDRVRIAVLGELREAEMIARAFTAALEDAEIESEVVLVDCAANEFEPCIAHLTACGFRGVSVGNPFKPEAAKLAREFFVVKHGMGVANALRLGKDVYGQNTEVPAFSSMIRDLKPGVALVMGSGRAARSAVLSLFEHGWRIRVWNRNVIRSRPFAIAFETYGKLDLASQPNPAGCSLIVNATPIGVKPGEQPPVKWEAAGARMTAIDFTYRGVATEFLRSASQRGFPTVDGRRLVVEQAALALEWWLARDFDRVPMIEAVGLRRGP